MCLALGPVSLYFLLLGIINLGKRPLLVTGTRDTAALGLALAGFVVVGPMQLFLPENAAQQFGGYVWLMLISFYALCLTLWLLLARPRLVIYNLSMNRLRPVLSELSLALDPEARWAGNSVCLPQLGVYFHVEDFAIMQNISLISTGGTQSVSGWQRFEFALRAELKKLAVRRNPRGFSLITSGAMMITVIVYRTLENPQDVARGLYEMLRL